MKSPSLISLALLWTLTACGAGATDAAATLAGHWAQHTVTGAKGMTLEFDAASDKVMAHTAPEADGSHEHLSGTYTLDAAAQTVTVHCALLGTGAGDVWQGELDAEQLTVASGKKQLTFRKGENPHDD